MTPPAAPRSTQGGAPRGPPNDGAAGDEATDLYALGATMFRAFTGEFPYGNADAASPPRRERPKDLAALRPDLPAWLGAVLARAIAYHVLPEPGDVVLRSDVLRKQLFGAGAEERLAESAYRPEVSRKVYEILFQQAGRILSQGHSVIADAVFARENERTAILEVARQSRAGFVGLFLVTDLKTRQRRITRRIADASDATAEIARLQEQYDIGAVDWTIIDASGTPEETLSACRKLAGLNLVPE